MTRILLADDHPMIGAALDVLLRGSDYELVARAGTGGDAIAQVQREKPDLLLLDVNMPDRSGLDVLRELRESRRAPAVVRRTTGASCVGATFQRGSIVRSSTDSSTSKVSRTSSAVLDRL